MNPQKLKEIKKSTLLEYPNLIHPNYQKHELEERVVLSNCDIIDPENINHYIARNGYFSILKAVQKTPKDVIEDITSSGLRGRGGGGFPTGKKWLYAANEDQTTKYVICNADEGDPGAFMDRSILEKDPHSVLEGMMIAGFAIGATQGYIYVRAEYPLAAKRIQKAIDDCYTYQLLGTPIFNSDYYFNIEVRLGAGAFVCGEETALIESIKGNRGMSNAKPPYPAISGLHSKPTVINNVETLANIPKIILHGSTWFRSFGTTDSPGTKVFALAGKISNSGLIEVPMGIPLRDIIFRIGNGVSKNRSFKAVLTGGPSGGCLTTEHLDIPVEFDTLSSLGSMMGSGGMIVLDDRDCMVDIASFYLSFTVDESCGKCTPCREGTVQLQGILQKIKDGFAEKVDLDHLTTLSHLVKNTSLCGLGITAPNPILSTLKYFREEYEQHILDNHCSAGKCTAFIHHLHITDTCVGCEKCKTVCPKDCIDGGQKHQHTIRVEDCILCKECFDICPVNAIETR